MTYNNKIQIIANEIIQRVYKRFLANHTRAKAGPYAPTSSA